jgi:hypothetical protein
MTTRGSCHCGAIAFSFEVAPATVIECNCSICRRRGALLTALDPEAFRLETPREAISTYTFHNHVIQHRFCAVCGCAPFAEGVIGGKAMMMINLRCTDADLDALEVMKFDGASL